MCYTRCDEYCLDMVVHGQGQCVGLAFQNIVPRERIMHHKKKVAALRFMCHHLPRDDAQCCYV